MTCVSSAVPMMSLLYHVHNYSTKKEHMYTSRCGAIKYCLFSRVERRELEVNPYTCSMASPLFTLFCCDLPGRESAFGIDSLFQPVTRIIWLLENVNYYCVIGYEYCLCYISRKCNTMIQHNCNIHRKSKAVSSYTCRKSLYYHLAIAHAAEGNNIASVY